LRFIIFKAVNLVANFKIDVPPKAMPLAVFRVDLTDLSGFSGEIYVDQAAIRKACDVTIVKAVAQHAKLNSVRQACDHRFGKF